MVTGLLVVLLLLPVQGVVQQVGDPAAAAAKKPSQPDADGVYTPGGDVVPPVLVTQKNPDVSRRVRKHAVTGMTEVALVVDVQGVPQKVTAAQSCGNTDLDAAAIKAVTAYRFRPATKGGVPVAVKMNVDVNWMILGKMRVLGEK